MIFLLKWGHNSLRSKTHLINWPRQTNAWLQDRHMESCPSHAWIDGYVTNNYRTNALPIYKWPECTWMFMFVQPMSHFIPGCWNHSTVFLEYWQVYRNSEMRVDENALRLLAIIANQTMLSWKSVLDSFTLEINLCGICLKTQSISLHA